MVIGEAAAALQKDPSIENWKKLAKELEGSKVKYYSISFGDGKLSGKDDLTKAEARLYDSRKRKVAAIPIFIKNGRKIEGALIYLRGLSILNGNIG